MKKKTNKKARKAKLNSDPIEALSERYIQICHVVTHKELIPMQGQLYQGSFIIASYINYLGDVIGHLVQCEHGTVMGMDQYLYEEYLMSLEPGYDEFINQQN